MLVSSCYLPCGLDFGWTEDAALVTFLRSSILGSLLLSFVFKLVALLRGWYTSVSRDHGAASIFRQILLKSYLDAFCMGERSVLGGGTGGGPLSPPNSRKGGGVEAAVISSSVSHSPSDSQSPPLHRSSTSWSTSLLGSEGGGNYVWYNINMWSCVPGSGDFTSDRGGGDIALFLGGGEIGLFRGETALDPSSGITKSTEGGGVSNMTFSGRGGGVSSV